jgi:hypothetical protein
MIGRQLLTGGFGRDHDTVIPIPFIEGFTAQLGESTAR